VTVFARQIATATRLIAQYGEAVEWWQRGELNAGGTPAKPSGASSPVKFEGVKLVWLTQKNESLADMFSRMSPDTPDVPSGGKAALMAPFVGLVPGFSDYVKRPNGSVLILDPKKGVSTLEPDGTPILYYLRFLA
jgi:hypothetical protein